MFTELSSHLRQSLHHFLPALLLSLFLFPFFSSSSYAGPVENGIASVASSLPEYEPLPAPLPKGSSLLLDESAIQLAATSEASLSAQYETAK